MPGAQPHRVSANGLSAPADATHFALSCSSSESALPQAISASNRPLEAAASAASGCVLLALPHLQPLRLLDGEPGGDRGGAHAGGSVKPLALDEPIVNGSSALVEDRAAGGTVVASVGLTASVGDEMERTDDEEEDAMDNSLPPVVDPAALEGAIRVAERFRLVETPLSESAPSEAHMTVQLRLQNGALCVALRQPMHLHAAPIGKATACETLRLHMMLFPLPSAEASGSEGGGDKLTWARPAPRLSLRVLQWNVLDGCQQAAPRLGGIGRWLRRRSVDVVTLNEMNGWSDRSFARLARSWGFGYSAFLETGTGYHLAIASRFPMVVERATAVLPFHHGALLVQIGGLRLCVTHLSPRDATHRLGEAKEILRIEERPPRRGFALLGDLNTLSPLDADEHTASGLVTRLRADEGLARKFLVKPTAAPAAAVAAAAQLPAADPDAVSDGAGGTASTVAPAGLFSGGWLFGGVGASAGGGTLGSSQAIDYAPMRALLDGGLADTGHSSSRRAADGDEVQNHSVPTLINEDVMHAAAMRLDYAMVNAPLNGSCTLSGWITRDAHTERLSDHYPLLVDIDCEAW